jgi:ligand-binding SRPBCC domain-containing protein
VSDIYELATWQWLPRPRPEVFAFFSDARNLERITPPFLKFQVLTADPIDMRAGTLVDYRLRLHGLPLRWQSEIAAWDPPARFADVQRRGPYRQWEHTHTFGEQDGGTLVQDQVRYRLRGPDVLTRAVNAWLVAPDTRRIFAFRHHALEQCLGLQGETRSGPVVIARRRL